MFVFCLDVNSSDPRKLLLYLSFENRFMTMPITIRNHHKLIGIFIVVVFKNIAHLTGHQDAKVGKVKRETTPKPCNTEPMTVPLA